MSSALSIFSILASLSLVLIMIEPSLANEHNRLRKLCSKTDDHQLCNRLMKADSRSSNANYKDLTEISIDLAYAKAKETHRDIRSLIDGTSNRDLRKIYNSCSKNYHDVLRNLQETKNLFREGDYKRISVQVKDAVAEVRNCKDQVKSKEKENTWSNLDKRNREFELLCDVVRVSAKYWNDDRKNKKN